MDKTDKEWIQELMNKFQQSEITKIKIRCGEIELEMEKEASRGKKSSGIISETDTDGQEGSQKSGRRGDFVSAGRNFLCSPLS